MAANQHAVATLGAGSAAVAVFSIPTLAKAIIDAWYKSLPQPLELSDSYATAEFRSIRLAIRLGLGLHQMALNRPWHVMQIIDRLQDSQSWYDTPLGFETRVHHLIIQHPLDLYPSADDISSYHQDYGMQRILIHQSSVHFTNLRDLVHEFNFPRVRLSDIMQTRDHLLRTAMRRWVGYVRAVQYGNLQLTVVLSDRFNVRDDQADEITVPPHTPDLQVVQLLMTNVGQRYRLA